MIRKTWALLAVVAVVAASGVAMADDDKLDEAGSDGTRPWAEGVSQEDQNKATELFEEGTKLLKDSFFTRSVVLYEQALKHWDHPAIHFNLAKALMNLDRPTQAYYALEACLRFGGAPLDAEQIEQVDRYRKLLYSTELAELKIETDEPGARVSLDGVELFVGPGTWQRVVQPSKTKSVIVTKTGFQTEQIEPELTAGELTTLKVELTAIENITLYETEFDTWIPWLVSGVGVAFLAGGGVLTWQSGVAYDEYDTAVRDCSNDNPFKFTNDAGEEVGSDFTRCIADGSVTDKRDRGDLFKTLSIASYALGGAALATGIVLFIVNQEQPITVEMPVTVTPYIGPERAGVSATISF